jgi:RNA 2',3'-cyclic 3'-phosphodiesterase
MGGDLFGGGNNNGSSPVAASRSDRRRAPGAVFFAVKPDEETGKKALAQAKDLQAAHGLRDRLQARELFHITLFAIGNFPTLPQAQIDDAIKTAAAFRMQPFEITLDRALTFDTKKPKLPLVLAGSNGVTKVRMLRQALLADMKRAGIRPTAGSDEPHMTLLYDPRKVPEQPIEPLSWTARDFVLVHSHFGLGKHEELGRWPLRG